MQKLTKPNQIHQNPIISIPKINHKPENPRSCIKENHFFFLTHESFGPIKKKSQMWNKLIKALAQPKAINMEANPTKPIPTFRQKNGIKEK